MRNSIFFTLLVLALLASGASAQYPRRGGGGYGGARSKAGPGLGAPIDEPPGSFAGVIDEATKNRIHVEFADGNGLSFYCSSKTDIMDGDKKLKCAELANGMHVTVDSRHSRAGTLDAVKVRVVSTDPRPQLATRP